MEDFVNRFPALRFSSLPHMAGDQRWLELGVRGPQNQVAEGLAFLKAALDARGHRWAETP